MRKALVALIVFVPLVAFASGEGESPQTGGAAAEVMLTSLPRDGQSDYNLSDYEQLTGTVIGSYNQSPILDARVASGELPPVAGSDAGRTAGVGSVPRDRQDMAAR